MIHEKWIKSISYNQHEIIHDIIEMHCPKGIYLDPTYSKGNFYKNDQINVPAEKYDLHPQTNNTKKSNANKLPHHASTIPSIMFDPPFLPGVGNKTGIMHKRFDGFKNIKELWQWYSECLNEFHRILEQNGTLIFKCQDTVSGGKQWLSHVYIIKEAERIGFYTKDLFVLLAKHRLRGHNHSNQQHARKFHSYFIVFKKEIKKAK